MHLEDDRHKELLCNWMHSACRLALKPFQRRDFTMAHAYSLAPRGRATTAVTFHFQVCFVNSNVVVGVGSS